MDPAIEDLLLGEPDAFHAGTGIIELVLWDLSFAWCTWNTTVFRNQIKANNITDGPQIMICFN